MLAIVGALATAATISAPKPVSLHYNVYVGDPSHPVLDGRVWLLRYSWYGTARERIGTIREGMATIEFDRDVMARLDQPANSHDDFVLAAIELPSNVWYMSREVDPNRFFSDLPAAIKTIGASVNVGPAGTPAIGLMPTVKRTITLLNDDGSAATGRWVGISEHVSDENRCAAEEGPFLGSFESDHAGIISIRTTLAPLFLSVRYFENVGGLYNEEFHVIVGPVPDIVVRRTWELPEKSVTLTVHDATGRPAAGHLIETQIRAETCGGVSGGSATTDADGAANLTLEHLAIQLIWVDLPGGQKRTLTQAEMHVLFARGSLTIRL